MTEAASYTEEVIKRGRKAIGQVRTYIDGRRVYLAQRRQSEIYRSGHTTLSDAMRSGKAGWMLDEETLILIKTRAIPFIGVLVVDTGDAYLVRAELWFDRGPAKRWFRQAPSTNAWAKEPQRVMPLNAFAFRAGAVQIALGA